MQANWLLDSTNLKGLLTLTGYKNAQSKAKSDIDMDIQGGRCMGECCIGITEITQLK